MSLPAVDRHARKSFPTEFAEFPDITTFSFRRFEPLHKEGLRYMEGLYLGSFHLTVDSAAYDLDIVSWAPSAGGLRAAIVVDDKEFQSMLLLNLLQDHQVSLVEPFASVFDWTPSLSIQPAYAKLAATVTSVWLQRGDTNGRRVWLEAAYCFTFSEAFERACQAIGRTKARTLRAAAPIQAPQPFTKGVETVEAAVKNQPNSLPERLPVVYPQSTNPQAGGTEKTSTTVNVALKNEKARLKRQGRQMKTQVQILEQEHAKTISTLKQQHVQEIWIINRNHAEAIEDLKKDHAKTISSLETKFMHNFRVQEGDNDSKASAEYFSVQQEKANTSTSVTKDWLEDGKQISAANTANKDATPSVSVHDKIDRLEKSIADLRHHMCGMKRDIIKGNYVGEDLNSRMDKINDAIYNIKIHDRLDKEQLARMELAARALYEGGKLERTNTGGLSTEVVGMVIDGKSG